MYPASKLIGEKRGKPSSMLWRRLLVPIAGHVVLLTIAVIFLYELLAIRRATGTSYNDIFAIPVTVILAILLLIDIVRTIWSNLQSNEIPKFGEIRTKAVMALCLAIYLSVFEFINFLFGSFLFMMILSALLARLHGSVVGRRNYYIVWPLVSIAMIFSIYYTFDALLGVDLP